MKTKRQLKRQREYNRRRRRSHRNIAPQMEPLPLIDGNWSVWICGYCKAKKGYLTVNLANCHNCNRCRNYEEEILSSS